MRIGPMGMPARLHTAAAMPNPLPVSGMSRAPRSRYSFKIDSSTQMVVMSLVKLSRMVRVIMSDSR